ncbi:DUF3606 domain-containing protein [Pseudomonas graminis]|uniref:DUF3606 domain-containing protein n=1 Tax=Pseudomonas graminis TaxID=158627 RepID=UPI00106106D9|nr:DUF3606 domain-containing protein [Pseudomonas graminis]
MRWHGKAKIANGTDGIRINPDDGSELKYWSNKFGVTKQEILTAVGEVGDSSTAVTNYFKPRR